MIRLNLQGAFAFGFCVLISHAFSNITINTHTHTMFTLIYSLCDWVSKRQQLINMEKTYILLISH